MDIFIYLINVEMSLHHDDYYHGELTTGSAPELAFEMIITTKHLKYVYLK